jgi:Zn-dependent protease
MAEQAARSLGRRFVRNGRGGLFSTWPNQLLRRVVITGSTMLLSLVAAGLYFGRAFGTGVVALIFLHECGHVWACRRLGLPVGDMFFIPLVGAAVTLWHNDDMAEGAYVAIMGPVFGAVGGVICVLIGYATGASFWLDLAEFDLGITLFNLLPIGPLDGTWIAPVLFTKARRGRYDRAGIISADARLRLSAAYVGLAVFLALAVYWLPERPFFPPSPH